MHLKSTLYEIYQEFNPDIRKGAHRLAIDLWENESEKLHANCRSHFPHKVMGENNFRFR